MTCRFSHVIGRDCAVVTTFQLLEAGWADLWTSQVMQPLNSTHYPQ